MRNRFIFIFQSLLWFSIDIYQPSRKRIDIKKTEAFICSNYIRIAWGYSFQTRIYCSEAPNCFSEVVTKPQTRSIRAYFHELMYVPLDSSSLVIDTEISAFPFYFLIGKMRFLFIAVEANRVARENEENKSSRIDKQGEHWNAYGAVKCKGSCSGTTVAHRSQHKYGRCGMSESLEFLDRIAHKLQLTRVSRYVYIQSCQNKHISLII